MLGAGKNTLELFQFTEAAFCNHLSCIDERVGLDPDKAVALMIGARGRLYLL